MAGRDTLRIHAEAFLDDGEAIGRVFPAASGLNPVVPIVAIVSGLIMTNTGLPFYFGLGLAVVGLVLMAQARSLVVAVTDHAVVVMESGALFPFRAKSVMARLPADTMIGPATGLLWKRMGGLSEALATPVRVHWRYVGDAIPVTER